MNRRHPVPAEVYALVEQTPATMLLEGGKPGENRDEPWTRLFIVPVRVCAAWEAAEIPALFAEIERAVAAGLSAAGFVSYECGSCFEPTAAVRTRREGKAPQPLSGPSLSGPLAPAQSLAAPLAPPLAWFGIYERSYSFDHKTGKFVGGEPPELARFRSESGAGTDESAPHPPIVAEFALSEAEYARRIAAIHEWIRAGDVYQLNFTAPWRVAMRAPAPGSVAALYAGLRVRQPVDYGAFVHWQEGRRILSFSPELFFRVDSDGVTRHIVTRPMKGTAPRGRTMREDREIAAWLGNDPKNRAENVMIVDLERNDLGRVAQTGSVRAEQLFAVERYPTLWQMTSTVNAELRPEVGYYDIFRALFPCGSVTGAPKVRAMQLLAELEDGPRGVYTGAIGFFSPRQTVFNVAIRTLELDGMRGTMGAGSGIVIDSVAVEEYRECLLKAEFLTRSAQRNASRFPMPHEFFLIETMLWDGGYPLLELHLDRLTDSADYFDIACQRAEVDAALEAHALRFADAVPRSPRKVRLLLGADGKLQITSETFADGFQAHPTPNRHPERAREANEPKDLRLFPFAAAFAAGERITASIVRGRICEERTDPRDPMLYHKTSHRPVYAKALREATQAGFDDVLFLNLRNELTEGAISNVFVEKDGRWFTPPVECGLLAGVFRRCLLETRPEIEERVLRLEDLRTADAIYLTNAVRGLRRVAIEW